MSVNSAILFQHHVTYTENLLILQEFTGFIYMRRWAALHASAQTGLSSGSAWSWDEPCGNVTTKEECDAQQQRRRNRFVVLKGGSSWLESLHQTVRDVHQPQRPGSKTEDISLTAATPDLHTAEHEGAERRNLWTKCACAVCIPETRLTGSHVIELLSHSDTCKITVVTPSPLYFFNIFIPEWLNWHNGDWFQRLWCHTSEPPTRRSPAAQTSTRCWRLSVFVCIPDHMITKGPSREKLKIS